MPFVYSTASNTTSYAIYRPTDPKANTIIEKLITIHGGANVADKKIFTPRGKVTEVSKEDLELLEKDYHFIEHQKLGFISVEKSKRDLDNVVSKMTPKDKSAPLTPDDEQFKPKQRH